MDIRKQKKIFSAIYDRNVDKVFRFVLLKVSSEDTAKDITSETFARGWKAFLKTFENNPSPRKKSQIKNPRAFLYRVARNLIVDHYRDKAKTQPVLIEGEGLADPAISAEEQAFINTDFNLISKALRQLKDEYQDIILWRYVENMSYSEISKISGIKKSTVRVMAYRAIKELKGVLDIDKI